MPRVFLGGRVVFTRRMVTVATIDLVAIGGFVALGELRHAGTLAAGIETFAQFLGGWLLAAVLFRAYTPRSISTPRRALLVGGGTWTVAAVLGQLIRIIVDPLASFAPSFVLVSIAAGGVLVAGGRGLIAARSRGISPESELS